MSERTRFRKPKQRVRPTVEFLEQRLLLIASTSPEARTLWEFMDDYQEPDKPTRIMDSFAVGNIAGCTGTMISPHIFLTAAHCGGPPTRNVSFYRIDEDLAASNQNQDRTQSYLARSFPWQVFIDPTGVQDGDMVLWWLEDGPDGVPPGLKYGSIGLSTETVAVGDDAYSFWRNPVTTIEGQTPDVNIPDTLLHSSGPATAVGSTSTTDSIPTFFTDYDILGVPGASGSSVIGTGRHGHQIVGVTALAGRRAADTRHLLDLYDADGNSVLDAVDYDYFISSQSGDFQRMKFDTPLDRSHWRTVGNGDITSGPGFFVGHVGGRMVGPSWYRAPWNTPLDRSAAGFLLEDFEDGALNTLGVTASTGSVLGPGSTTDSVDNDDGDLNDFSGNGGRSFFVSDGSAGVNFEFNSSALPTQAGIVWTDGGGGTTFEAFDATGASLGTVGPIDSSDDSFSGGTHEDRFYGAIHPGGISSIHVRNESGGLEVDHLQFGPGGVPSGDNDALWHSTARFEANATYRISIVVNGRTANANGYVAFRSDSGGPTRRFDFQPTFDGWQRLTGQVTLGNRSDYRLILGGSEGSSYYVDALSVVREDNAQLDFETDAERRSWEYAAGSYPTSWGMDGPDDFSAMVAGPNTGQGWGVRNRHVALAPNRSYEVTFDAKQVSGVVNSQANVRVQDLNGVTKAEQSWQFTQANQRLARTFQFTTDSFPGNALAFGTPATGSFQIDNIQIRDLTGAFSQPIPYQSQQDSPFLDELRSGDMILEDFEDGQLNSPGVAASAGTVVGPGASVDSVDADSGQIDGSGQSGRSFFSPDGAAGITFNFSEPYPSRAGIAWTDGSGDTYFEAFDDTGQSLGLRHAAVADNSSNGTTAEDRFFGVESTAGVSAIHIWNTAGGIEVDHLQYDVRQNAQTGELSGLVFEDADGDGQRGAGEVGLAGLTVYLDLNENAVRDAGEPIALTLGDDLRTQDTDETGTYRFLNVPAGDYVIRQDLPSNYVQTTPGSSGSRLFAVQTSSEEVIGPSGVRGAITVPGQTDNFRFALPEPRRLHFDSLTNDVSIAWSLVGPGGSYVTNRSLAASDSYDQANPVLDLPAGAYSLTIDAVGDHTGTYSFRLLDLATATEVNPGSIVIGQVLSPANESDVYRFDSLAGQRFFFDGLEGFGNATWRLVDPYSNILFSSSFAADQDTLQLAEAGTYTVLIEGRRNATESSVPYSFNVQPVPGPDPRNLTLGQIVRDSIGVAGEQDQYAIAVGPEGARLHFDSLTDDRNLRWTLVGPSGTLVNNRSFASSDSFDFANPILNLPAGEHTLTVDGAGDHTASYGFRLLDLQDAPALALNQLTTAALDPASETDLYQFTASANDLLYFDLQAGFNNATWRLVDPAGNVLFNHAFVKDQDPVRLNQSGTYNLLVEGRRNSTGSADYALAVHSVTNLPAVSLGVGSTRRDSINVPGEQVFYNFELTGRTQLHFDSLTNEPQFRWTLHGPSGTVVDQRSFASSDSFDNAAPVLEVPAGSYSLVVDAREDHTGVFEFRLINLADAVPASIGSTISGELDPANETDTFQIAVSSGDQLSFESLSGNNNATWRLIDPFGNILFSSALTTSQPVQTLSQPGDYSLLIEGRSNSSGTAAYSFRINFEGNDPPTPPSGIPLEPGAIVNGTITTAGENDTYVFSTVARSRMYFDSLTNDSSLRWSLEGPSGVLVNQRRFTSSDAADIANPVLNLVPGIYALTVESTNNSSAYSFRLADLNDAEQIVPGTSTTGSLDPANETDLFQIQAGAGDQLFFDSESYSGAPNARWRLIDPFDNVLFHTLAGSDVDTLQIAQSGAYTVLIEGRYFDTAVGDYLFNVHRVADSAAVQLELGTAITGSIETPGAYDLYSFSLAEPAQLYFDSLTNDSNLRWSLHGLGSEVVGNRRFTATDSADIANPLLNLAAGDYTLTVDASGDSTAESYSFRLSDVASGTPVTLGSSVTGELNPANQSDIYRFDAVTGGRVFFDVQSFTGAPNARWRLIDPFGNVAFSTVASTDVDVISLTAGTYTLLIEGRYLDTEIADYTFNAQPITTNAPATLAIGGLTSGAISLTGESDEYSFTLADPARLYLDSLTNNSRMSWSLTGPGGAHVTARPFTGSDSADISNPVLNLPAGSYSLIVDASGDVTGSYSFQMFDLASAASLDPGTPVSSSLSPGNSTNAYQFPADGGDQFFFDSQSFSSAANARWRLIDPFDNVLFNTFAAIDEGPVELPETGVYTLLVEGRYVNTENADYTFNVHPVPPTFPVPITVGVRTAESISVPGEHNSYRFTLPDPARLYFDSLTNDSNIHWTLTGPPGSIVTNRTLTSSDSVDVAAPVLDLFAGVYTLSVAARGDATGNYEFRLLDLAQGRPITPNTPIATAELDPANETDHYSLQAVAGDEFFFDMLNFSGAANARWRLIDPYNNVLFSTSASSDVETIRLAQSGTYTLLVEGRYLDVEPASYSFNVQHNGNTPSTLSGEAVAIGQTINGTIGTAGEQDRYTFRLTRDSRVHFDSLSNNSNFRWSLEGPPGVLVSNRPFTSSDSFDQPTPVLRLPAGDYVLTVDASGDGTGDYAFRLLDLADAAPSTSGIRTVGELNPANETDLYSYQVQAGERLYFDVEEGIGNATWRLVGPLSNMIFSSGFTADHGTIELDQPGTYTILIEGRRNATAQANYGFTVHSVPSSPATGAIIELDPNTGAELNRFPAPDQVGAAAGLAFDGTSLYFMGDSDSLWTLDPDTGQVIGQNTVPNLAGSTGIAAMGGRVYVLGHDLRSLLQFDATTNDLISGIDLQTANPGVAFGGGLTASAASNTLFGRSNSGSALVEINPDNGQILRSLNTSTAADDGMASVAGEIYLADQATGTVDVVSQSGTLQRSISGPVGLVALGGDDPLTELPHSVSLIAGETVTGLNFGSQQVAGEVREETIPFSIDGLNAVPFELFSVLTPGTIRAEISWTGNSNNLSVELTGRRRPNLADPTTPYATVAGSSPLVLTYDVTDADLERGVGWRLAIRDASGQNSAQGTIRLTTPFDERLDTIFQREKVDLRSGELWPTTELQQQFLNQLQNPPSPGGMHGIISLHVAPGCADGHGIQQLGVTRQSFLPGRHSFGFVRQDIVVTHPLVLQYLRGLTPLEPEDKIDPHILLGNYRKFELAPVASPALSHVLNPDGTLELFVLFADDVPRARIQQILSLDAVASSDFTDNLWRATVNPVNLTTLAAHDEVEWISAGPTPRLFDLNNSRNSVNADNVTNPTINLGNNTITYAGITGAGVTVGVDDSGIDASHADLNVVVDDNGVGKHGTHVAGIIAASGVRSQPSGAGTPFQFRGIAPNAALIDESDLEDSDDVVEQILDNSMDVSNHSYSISYDGEYDSRNQTIDEQIRGGSFADDRIVPRRLKVFSAGNHGVTPQNGGSQIGYFSLTKQMKNAVIVGNWSAGANLLANGSSMGPTHDGRIKPDVVAPGVAVTSTGTSGGTTCYNGNATNAYGPCSGTSMAAPAVTGVAALMLEAWESTYLTPIGLDLDDGPPLPSTLRAVLVQTATDIVNLNVRGGSADVDADSLTNNGNDGVGVPTATAGPDFATGWGLVNAQAAVNLVQNSRTVNGSVPVPSQIIQESITHGRFTDFGFIVDAAFVAAGNPLQVTIAWDDVESATQNPATNTMLINDIDLELIAPDGTIFYPWQLGHTINDSNGMPLANNAQPAGTAIQIARPITPTATPGSNNDYVPANALQPGGAWAAVPGKDHLNNVEQVQVPVAGLQVGRWQARVIGFNIQSGAQDFSLVGFPYPNLPDLEASNSVKATLPGLNQPITFDWTATNAGQAGTGGTFNYQVLLSRDFSLGDDVLLTDANQATLGPLAAGASVQQTSTVQITQADVEALLGPGATFEDLVADDPFLLVRVDSDGQILEHNETNITFVNLARLVDVVFVRDRSGSMGHFVAVSNGNFRKIDLLRQSANLFLNLLRKDTGDRLGQVSFAGALGSDSTTTDLALTPFTTASLPAAQAAINRFGYGGSTDVEHGLQRGIDVMLTGGTAPERRRVIVFFSDGRQNDGSDPTNPAFLQQFTTNDISVYSVGYGTEGATDDTGIDEDLLNRLQNVGPDGYFHVTSDSVGLDKFFVNAVAGAVESQRVRDPIATVAPGESDTVRLSVADEDYELTFILSWDNPNLNLDLSLRLPSGALIHPGNASSFGSAISVTNAPAHKIITVRPPLPIGATTEHAGRWEMVITNPGTSDVHYMASVLAESTIKAHVPPPGPVTGTNVVVGDPILLQATLEGEHGEPITNASVSVTATVPAVSLGDILSSGVITAADLNSTPTDVNGDALSLEERIALAYRQRYGANALPKVELPPIPLTPGQTPGSYSGTHTSTIGGTQSYVVEIEGLTSNCQTVQREIPHSVGVPTTVNPTVTVVTTTPGNGTPTGGGNGPVVVTVTPRGNLGGYFGAGLADDIHITTTTGLLTPSSEIVDNLDGSYSQEFQVQDQGVTNLQIQALGVDLPVITMDLGIPAPSGISPAGGFNNVAQDVVISVASGASLARVTGASLVAGNTEIGLSNVQVDVAAGVVRGQVPSGVAAGIYQVRLDGASGSGMSSANATYNALAGSENSPGYVGAVANTIGDLLQSSDNAQGLLSLGRLLREIRSVPTGSNFTAAMKRAALSDVVGLIFDHDGLPEATELPNVFQALNDMRVDARFIPTPGQLTPEGVDVSVSINPDIDVTFGEVTRPGLTTVDLLSGPTGFPPSLRGQVHAAYDVTTTAVFDPAAMIDVTIDYDSGDFTDESNLRIYHREGSRWLDRTASVDIEGNRIRARVPGLSPFVILTGSADSSLGSISGRLFQDSDQSKSLDPQETGLEGWTVFIDHNNDGTLNNSVSGSGVCDAFAQESCTITDKNGGYLFDKLLPDTYRIGQITKAGWEAVAPETGSQQATLTGGGQLVESVDFASRESVDTQGPTIGPVRIVESGGRIRRIILPFSEPIVGAANAKRYRVSTDAGPDRRFGTRDDEYVAFRRPRYNASKSQVTLIPQRPFDRGSMFYIGVTGIRDTARNLLDGDQNGVPGGAYRSLIGSRLSYRDSNRDLVTITVSAGGLLELNQKANGDALDLVVLKGDPQRSVLRGTVRQHRTRGDGVTHLRDIKGLDKLRRNRLPSEIIVDKPKIKAVHSSRTLDRTLLGIDELLASDDLRGFSRKTAANLMSLARQR